MCKENEYKIYEFLGVKYFKKLTFKLEKIIHRKDKGTNINYHVKNTFSKESVNSFKKYLYYNGFIHAKNFIIGFLMILGYLILGMNPLLIFSTGVLIVKDAYCLMLQRYNYLKLNEFEKKLDLREEKKINREIENINKDELDKKILERKIDREELIKNLKILKSYLLEENNLDANLDIDSLLLIRDGIIDEKILIKKRR